MIDFIKSFRRKWGVYSDPLVERKTFFYNKLKSFKKLNFSNFYHQQTKIAESRQAHVALKMLKAGRPIAFTYFPRWCYSLKRLERYLCNLPSKDGWGTFAQINQLIFVYQMNINVGFLTSDSHCFLNICLKTIDKLQQQDGFWWIKETSPKQKINAAMKVISAFNIVEKKRINYAKKIIDFILTIKDDYYYDGCDNLNAMYVLYYAFNSTNRSYRKNEVHKYCQGALTRYKKYMRGSNNYSLGFSFLPNSNPRRYYGMKVTKGTWDADIHGTYMFTWAIALTLDILGENEEGLKGNIIN